MSPPVLAWKIFWYGLAAFLWVMSIVRGNVLVWFLSAICLGIALTRR